MDEFFTRQLYHTKNQQTETVTESVVEVHGLGSTLLMYDFDHPPRTAEDGKTSLRCYIPNDLPCSGQTVSTFATSQFSGIYKSQHDCDRKYPRPMGVAAFGLGQVQPKRLHGVFPGRFRVHI